MLVHSSEEFKFSIARSAQALIDAGVSPEMYAYLIFHPDNHEDAEVEIKDLSTPVTEEVAKANSVFRYYQLAEMVNLA